MLTPPSAISCRLPRLAVFGYLVASARQAQATLCTVAVHICTGQTRLACTFHWAAMRHMQAFSLKQKVAACLQAQIALANTALTLLGMWLLQIPGIVLLGLFVFICSFIPIAGIAHYSSRLSQSQILWRRDALCPWNSGQAMSTGGPEQYPDLELNLTFAHRFFLTAWIVCLGSPSAPSVAPYTWDFAHCQAVQHFLHGNLTTVSILSASLRDLSSLSGQLASCSNCLCCV